VMGCAELKSLPRKRKAFFIIDTCPTPFSELVG